jgi:hypothetical protein
MIRRKENIRSPFAEQLPQRDRVSRRVSRPGVRPMLWAWRATDDIRRSRAMAVRSAFTAGPVRGPSGTLMRPSAKRAARPAPATMGLGTPQTGIASPIRAMRGSGAWSRCPRTQSARSRRKASASSSGAQSGRLIETRPSLRETRSENRVARRERRSTTSIGGSPGRIWVDVPGLDDTPHLPCRVRPAAPRPGAPVRAGKALTGPASMADGRSSLDSDD